MCYELCWRSSKNCAVRILTWPETYVQVQKSASEPSFNRESGIYIRRATSLNESVSRKQYAPSPICLYVCLSLSLSLMKPEESDTVTADFYGLVFHESYRRPTVANASDNALSDGCQDTVCGYIGHIYAVKLLFRASECDISLCPRDGFFSSWSNYIYICYT